MVCLLNGFVYSRNVCSKLNRPGFRGGLNS